MLYAVCVSNCCVLCLQCYCQYCCCVLCIAPQDADLRSAVCLEQASFAFLRIKPVMARKHALHLILAGHRYAKAAQVCVCVRGGGGLLAITRVVTLFVWIYICRVCMYSMLVVWLMLC